MPSRATMLSTIEIVMSAANTTERNISFSTFFRKRVSESLLGRRLLRANLMLVGYVDIIVDCWIYVRGNAGYLACAKTR